LFNTDSNNNMPTVVVMNVGRRKSEEKKA